MRNPEATENEMSKRMLPHSEAKQQSIGTDSAD
jgi:hypothetical protein